MKAVLILGLLVSLSFGFCKIYSSAGSYFNKGRLVCIYKSGYDSISIRQSFCRSYVRYNDLTGELCSSSFEF